MEPEHKTEDEVTVEADKTNAAEAEEQVKTDDVSEHKTLAIVGYIIPFLFFLPLLDEKTKNLPFVRFHANQQLLLVVIYLGLHLFDIVFFNILMVIGYYLISLINLALLVLMVIGAMNAYKGLMKELPIIGHFRLIK